MASEDGTRVDSGAPTAGDDLVADGVDWVELVRECDEPDLPVEVRRGVLQAPEATTPQLIGLLHDDDVLNEYGAIHAIALLGEIRADAAIPELVRLLVDEPGTRLAEAADEALRTFGSDAIPSLLVAMRTDADCVAYTLGGCTAALTLDDPRFGEVRESLMELLSDDPAFAADCLVQLGDTSVIPRLLWELEQARINEEDGMVAGQAIVELVRAIERLGGDAGELGQRRLKEVELVRAPMLELMSQITATRL